jgi:hypothetical protein
MTSEWMKVMLEEIERKKVDAEQARIEEERRTGERGAAVATPGVAATPSWAAQAAPGAAAPPVASGSAKG